MIIYTQHLINWDIFDTLQKTVQEHLEQLVVSWLALSRVLIVIHEVQE